MSYLADILWIPSLKAAGVVLLVLLVQRLLGARISPTWRHALWSLVFLRLLLPVLPASPWSLFRLAPVDPNATPIPGLLALPATAFQGSAAAPEASFPLLELAALIWALGFGVLGIRRLHAFLSLHRQLRHATAISAPRLLSLFATAQKLSGVSARVSLLEVPGLSGPAAHGIWRPSIVVPSGFGRGLDDEAILHVFLHELAHVKRKDVLALTIAGWLEAVHWFNPLVRWAVRRSNGDGELACDAAVLRLLPPEGRLAYGSTLLRLTTERPLPMPVLGISSKRELQRRISMISTFRPPTRPSTFLAAALLLALGAISLTDAIPAVAAPENPPTVTPEQAAMDGVAATVKDLRDIGTAMFRWAQTQNKNNVVADSENDELKTFDWKDCPKISHDDLQALLIPGFLGAVPRSDRWGNDYEFCLDPTLENRIGAIGVRARGSDGRFEGDVYQVGAFPLAETQRDIVWIDGFFLTWPGKP